MRFEHLGGRASHRGGCIEGEHGARGSQRKRGLRDSGGLWGTRPERRMVAAVAPCMNSSAPGLGKLAIGGKLMVDMDLLLPLNIAGAAGRHVEHDRTGKTDFNPLNAKGTKLSHLSGFGDESDLSGFRGRFDLSGFRDWPVEGRLSSSRWIATRLIFGENRQVWFARLASDATSPFTAIYVKVASNVDRGSSRRDEVGFERRSARVLGPFQVQMSNRVAEGGLKTPINQQKWRKAWSE